MNRAAMAGLPKAPSEIQRWTPRQPSCLKGELTRSTLSLSPLAFIYLCLLYHVPALSSQVPLVSLVLRQDFFPNLLLRPLSSLFLDMDLTKIEHFSFLWQMFESYHSWAIVWSRIRKLLGRRWIPPYCDYSLVLFAKFYNGSIRFSSDTCDAYHEST